MPRKLAAGNWKMNGTAADLAEITALVAAHPSPSVDLLICPPDSCVRIRASCAVAEQRKYCAGRFMVQGTAGAMDGILSPGHMLWPTRKPTCPRGLPQRQRTNRA